MRKNAMSISKAITDGQGHVVCNDGIEFDIKPIDNDTVILHHIEKEGRQALNNRVKMKVKDAEIFVQKKHKGIKKLGEEKYSSVTQEKPAVQETVNKEENEDEFAEKIIQNGMAEITESEPEKDEWESGDWDETPAEENAADDFAAEENMVSKESDDFELFSEEEEAVVSAGDGGYDWDDEPNKEESSAESENDVYTPAKSPVATQYEHTESTIACDMIVTGDVISKSSVTVFGGVDGNVTAVRKVIVAGGINGDVNAGEDVELYRNGTDESTEVRGDIIAKGDLYIEEDCVVLGNLQAANAVIKGSVLGEVDIKGRLSVCSGARIKGNITTKEIEVEPGAIIEGACMQTYAANTAENFFKQYESRLQAQRESAEAVKKNITSISEDITMKELVK